MSAAVSIITSTSGPVLATSAAPYRWDLISSSSHPVPVEDLTTRHQRILRTLELLLIAREIQHRRVLRQRRGGCRSALLALTRPPQPTQAASPVHPRDASVHSPPLISPRVRPRSWIDPIAPRAYTRPTCTRGGRMRELPVGGRVPCGIPDCTAERCIRALTREAEAAHAKAALRAAREVRDAELTLLALALPHRVDLGAQPDDEEDEDTIVERRLVLLSALGAQPSVWRVGRTRPTAVPLPRTRVPLSEDERTEALRLISTTICRHTVDRGELAAEAWIELAYPTARVAVREEGLALARRVAKAVARAYARLRPSAMADGLPTRYRGGNGAASGFSLGERKGTSNDTTVQKRKPGTRDAA